MVDCWQLLSLPLPSASPLGKLTRKPRCCILWHQQEFQTTPVPTCGNPHPSPPSNYQKNPKPASFPLSLKPFLDQLEMPALSPPKASLCKKQTFVHPFDVSVGSSLLTSKPNFGCGPILLLQGGHDIGKNWFIIKRLQFTYQTMLQTATNV